MMNALQLFLFSYIHSRLDFAHRIQAEKPWFILIPNWVYMKPYYTETLYAEAVPNMFIVPKDRHSSHNLIIQIAYILLNVDILKHPIFSKPCLRISDIHT